MITQTGLYNILNYMSNLISMGRYLVNGKNFDVPIVSKNIDKNTLTVTLFLSDECNGNITEVKLIDEKGQVFASKPDNISKIGNEGVLVIFKFTVMEV